MFKLEQITDLISLPKGKLAAAYRNCVRATLVLACSYIAASTLSAFLMSTLVKSMLGVPGRMGRPTAVASIGSSSNVNYHDLRKAIIDRNLFNSEGQYPEEEEVSGQQQISSSSTEFDLNAPCKKTTLKVELLGTIYLQGSAESVATVKEKGYSQADVYRVGDTIIGSDSAVVAQIDQRTLVINNAGVKECLELLANNKKSKNDGFGSADVAPPPDSPHSDGPGTGEAPPPDSGDGCMLDEKYVADQLGPGFGTIIQKARLVPNTVDNKVNGFKIFAIRKPSLWGKVGLQNGDIITQVNDVSLKQPEQGFALYQAFQDEREVIIHILRRGKTPMTINCRIK